MSDNFDRKVMNYNQRKIIQLLNLSAQLDNTSLAQPVTKQCFILFSLWCKKIALAIKETTLKQKMVRYEEFWSIICHSLFYLAILTILNSLVNDIKNDIWRLNNLWFDCNCDVSFRHRWVCAAHRWTHLLLPLPQHTGQLPLHLSHHRIHPRPQRTQLPGSDTPYHNQDISVHFQFEVSTYIIFSSRISVVTMTEMYSKKHAVSYKWHVIKQMVNTIN